MEYGVVLSQDCDLNQDYNSRKEITDISNNQDNLYLNNKMIPSILICPAYLAEQLRKGTHLKSLNLPMIKISNSKKTPWKKNYAK